MALTDAKCRFTVPMDTPCLINQSRNVAALKDGYCLIGLSPKTFITQPTFRLAVLTKPCL